MKKSHIAQLRRHESAISAIQSAIEEMRDEMQETFDNRSESWQESDNGEIAAEEISNVESLLSDIEGVMDSFGNFELEE